jgi:hypothetical protein
MASLIYNTFKSGLMKGVYNLHTGGNTVKLALVNAYTPVATHAVWTDVSGDEVTGTGYTSGGATVTTTVSGTSTANFNTSGDITWSSSTITATGGIIYDSTASGSPLIAYVDFSGTQSSSNGNFTVSWTAASDVIISLT